MSEVVTGTIIGGRELEAKLKELDEKVSGKIVGNGLRAGAKIIYQAGEANVPVRTGNLQRGLQIRPLRTTRQGYKSIDVGVGAKWFHGPTFYAAFVEWGHRLGSRKLGDKRKFVEGEHYIEYAYDDKASEAADAIVDVIRAGIEAVATSKGA